MSYTMPIPKGTSTSKGQHELMQGNTMSRSRNSSKVLQQSASSFSKTTVGS